MIERRFMKNSLATLVLGALPLVSMARGDDSSNDLIKLDSEPEYEDMISEARHDSMEILEGAYTIEDEVTVPTDGVIPEPAYLGLLGASYLALRRRR